MAKIQVRKDVTIQLCRTCWSPQIQCTTTSTYYDLCLAHYIYITNFKKNTCILYTEIHIPAFIANKVLKNASFIIQNVVAGQWLSIKTHCILHSSLYLPKYMCIHACITYTHTRRTHFQDKSLVTCVHTDTHTYRHTLTGVNDSSSSSCWANISNWCCTCSYKKQTTHHT